MNALLKLGVGVVGFLVLYGLAAPMVFFVADLVRYPDALRIEMTASYLNESHAKLIITLRYNGSVELRDVRLTVLKKELCFGDLTKGSEVSRAAVLPASMLQEVGREVSISFSVVGLYPVELRTRGEGYGLS